MDHEALEKRKKTIYSLLCDDFYVPMKAKEMAMLLQIPKSQRAELQEVLDELVLEGKLGISKKGKYGKHGLIRAASCNGLEKSAFRCTSFISQS